MKKVIKGKKSKNGKKSIRKTKIKNKEFLVSHGNILVKFNVIFVDDLAIHGDEDLILLAPDLAKEFEAKLDKEIAKYLGHEEVEHIQKID